MTRTLILLPALLLSFLSFSQDKNELKVKFGKISDEEIKMTHYSKDPDAPAVILFDKGL